MWNYTAIPHTSSWHSPNLTFTFLVHVEVRAVSICPQVSLGVRLCVVTSVSTVFKWYWCVRLCVVTSMSTVCKWYWCVRLCVVTSVSTVCKWYWCVRLCVVTSVSTVCKCH
jgi:hypothetical protein